MKESSTISHKYLLPYSARNHASEFRCVSAAVGNSSLAAPSESFLLAPVGKPIFGFQLTGATSSN